MVRAFTVVAALALFSLTLPLACKSNSHPSDGGAVDAARDLAPHRCLYVDDLGVTHGCSSGGMGPGDRDDGGGAPAPPPPDANPASVDQPFGAECFNNQQCASMLCYYYRVKGQFCTQLCAANSDCPASSLGCNGQGVCRVGN